MTQEENSAFILAHPNQDKDTRASMKIKSTQSNYTKLAGQLTSMGKSGNVKVYIYLC